MKTYVLDVGVLDARPQVANIEPGFLARLDGLLEAAHTLAGCAG